MIRKHLNWTSFEVNASEDGQSKAFRFESLCHQLFANEFLEKESHQRFLQSAVNNPGIEAEPIYSEKERKWIGFQAKYFSKNISYDAILDSCAKAVKYYKGRLEEIILFCNLHPSPRSKTFIKTEKNLKSNGITLTVIAGDAILDLVREYDKLGEYYFGQHRISDKWICEHDELMINVLGDRFEKGFNVNTRSADLLSLFSLDNKASELVNKKKKDLLSKIDSIYWKHYHHQKYLTSLYKATEQISDVQPYNITDAFGWHESIMREMKAEIDKLTEKKNALTQKNLVLAEDNKGHTTNKDWQHDYDKNYDEIKKIEDLISLPDSLKIFEDEKSLITGKILAISGKAGTGKSHMFAHETKVLLEEGRSPLLFLAGMYSSEGPIQKQIMENCELSFTFRELVSILEMKGAEKGNPIMIFIDALNETRDRNLWESQLPAMISHVEKCSFVRLAFSFRPEYNKEILGESVRESISNGEILHFYHEGFKNLPISATREFFNHYNIPFGLYEFFQTNMDNPLFLRLYCKTYEGDEVSLPVLYDRLISKANENIWKNMAVHLKSLGYSKSDNLLQPLIYELASWFAFHSTKIISRKEIRTLDYWQEHNVTTRPFLKKVIEEGILITFPKKTETGVEDHFSFTFDQMNDYFLAKTIVMSSQSKEELREKILNDVLIVTDKDINSGSYDLFINICALYAEEYGEECIDILDAIDAVNKDEIIKRYILSFKWRNWKTIRSDDFKYLLHKFPIRYDTVFDVLIHNSIKRNHPLNAEFLDSILRPMPLNMRDQAWTIVINLLEKTSPRAMALINLYDSGDKLDGLEKGQTWLLLILLSWFLTATNREIRDRTSKAMIEILKVDFDLCLPLLMKFEGINDPYVIQRLHGIVFGACTKRTESHEQEFKKLTEYIYSTVFAKDEVYPDILLRDYARLTIELFLAEHPQYSGPIDKTRIAPPYHSTPIPKIDGDFSNDDFSNGDFSEEHYGSFNIINSMALEEMIWYGDFGRYVFERALKQFDVDMLNLHNYAIIFIRDELGYSDSLFSRIDKIISQEIRQRSSRRIERIGKKYQWIAFYNILARVCDNCRMINSGLSDYNRDDSKYEGPWNPYVRDFDPTLNEYFLACPDAPLFDGLENHFRQSRADNFNNDISYQEWLETPGLLLEKLGANLIQKDNKGTSWVILDGHFDPGHGTRIQNSHKQWALTYAFFIPEKAFTFLSKGDNWKRSFPWSILHRHETYTVFNREYPWSISCNELRTAEQENPLFDVETSDGGKRQIEFSGFLHATDRFSWEEEYDYSKKGRIDRAMPCTELIKALELHREGFDCAFYDKDRRLAAFDMRFNHHCEAVALRQDLLDGFLKQTKMKLVWFVQAEKSIQDEESPSNGKYKEMIGFFSYKGKIAKGETLALSRNDNPACSNAGLSIQQPDS